MVDIIQGADKTVQLTFVQNNAAFSLVGATAISVFFPGSVEKTLGAGVTVTSAASGIVTVTLTNADTLAMTLGRNQPIEIVADFGSDRRIIPLRNVVNIIERIY